MLNMSNLDEQGTYFGIPFAHTKKQVYVYQPLLQKLTLRIDFWKRHSLSEAGHLIIIEWVIQAIPLHIMSCLKLLQTICNLLDQQARKFY